MALCARGNSTQSVDTTSKKSSKISFLNLAGWSRHPLLVISTVVNNEKFLNWRSSPDLVLLTNQKLMNIFRCLRVGTLTGCPLRSNKDEEFPARWCFIFFYPPCTSREKWVRTTTSFKLAIEIFSIRKTLSSDHFDKLAFSLNKKFANDVIFLHADTLTGCPLDPNNIIKFRAYRRNLLLSAPYVTRNLSGDKNGLFVVDEDFFIVCTRHACARLHSIIFCSPGFSLHTHLL